MIIETIQPFDGVHCETTATGTLLNQIGIELSEPMLFGLGEGLGFIFWHMKSMSFPFIGGRIKPDMLTENITRNLGLALQVQETASVQKAWSGVRDLIDKNQVVGLKLDCFHLEYFSNPVHFAGHYVALYGYDEKDAFLVDTRQQGGMVKTSLNSLAQARAEKGAMASRNLYYTIQKTSKGFDLNQAIVAAIRNNATAYLNPPINNIGYKGIWKTSTEMIKWFKASKQAESNLATIAMLMEKAGTGGSLFRNLYRDFLKESFDRLEIDKLKNGYEAFKEIALQWKEVADLFIRASETRDINYMEQAAALLKVLSKREQAAMQALSTI